MTNGSPAASPRPRIAVPAFTSTSVKGLRRSGIVVAQRIIEAVFRAGGEPMLIPPGPGDMTRRLAGYDGAVLPGGADIDPSLYGAELDPLTEEFDRAQDDFDLACVRAFLDLGLPFLAICRGMQVVNVAFGGTLIQHLPEKPLQHRGTLHPVTLAPGCAVAEAMGDTVVEVSSYHHQAIDRLGTDLRVVGRAADGCIEAIDHPTAPMLAIQWHPEDNAASAAEQQALFDATVDRARSHDPEQARTADRARSHTPDRTTL